MSIHFFFTVHAILKITLVAQKYGQLVNKQYNLCDILAYFLQMCE